VKANRKALADKAFILATFRRVKHPSHRTVKQAKLLKDERKRKEQRQLNLIKFKQKKQGRIDDEQKPLRPNGLVFSGGE
jgi:hypothetical protein